MSSLRWDAAKFNEKNPNQSALIRKNLRHPRERLFEEKIAPRPYRLGLS